MNNNQRIVGFPAMFITLLIFWCLVSGAFDYQHIIAGSASALLVAWYWRGLLRRIQDRHDILPYKFLFCPYSVLFALHLLFMIFKANINVALIVLNPKLPIAPVVIRTKTGLKHDLTRVAFAHSITLTPGTLTLGLTDDTLVVHSITDYAANIESMGRLEGWIDGIERRLE